MPCDKCAERREAAIGKLTVPGLLGVLSLPSDEAEIVDVVVEYKYMPPAPNVCPRLTPIRLQDTVWMAGI